MSRRSVQSITAMPPPHHAQYMRLPRIIGGPCRVIASSCGWPATSWPLRRLLHPGQPPDADDFGLERVLDVERPDHALVPSRRAHWQEGEIAFVVDAEAVRAASRHVVEADRLRLAALRDVEDEQAGARVACPCRRRAARSSRRAGRRRRCAACGSGTGRRAELADLVRLPRFAHVMHGEASGPLKLGRRPRRHRQALVHSTRLPPPQAAEGSWPISEVLASSGIWTAIYLPPSISSFSCPALVAGHPRLSPALKAKRGWPVVQSRSDGVYQQRHAADELV